VAAVHPTAEYTSHALGAWSDDCIPGFRRLADTVHAEGAGIIGQVFHGGREIMDSDDGTLPVPLAPSSVPSERFHTMPRSMSVPEIREIVEGASRRPGSGRPAWTGWRSSPATATCPRSSSAPA
jgi:2,4-dienoyl-CoA reductase-like NADH-dependent reductase (Old Yellow Enzyme family)